MPDARPVRLPELLAPAGSIEAGLTALDAGADAVYAGLRRWGARAGAKNLTGEELSKLLACARRRGRRVYVTLNTLLRDRELAAVVSDLSELAAIRPDAVIVQDLGLVRLLREAYPSLEVHGSTQMALHNSAGLAVAERLGLRRVILERQTTLEEVEAMLGRSSVELEVFVHGALCCSRSGLCLFSSWLGGESGNRGRCKQPCRRRYRDGSGRRGFFFSPADLSGLEDLPRLAELGLAGLKIEGRLRRPDSVRRIVRAYRRVLDGIGGDLAGALEEARADLARAAGRPGRRLFRAARDFEGVILHESVGAAGTLVGRVLVAGPRGTEVETTAALHLWDALRIQPRGGQEGVSVVVSTLEVDGRRVTRVGPGRRCRLARVEGAAPGSLVYWTGSATSDLAARVAALPLAAEVVDLHAHLGAGALRVELEPGGEILVLDAPLEPARSRPIDAAALAAELARSGRPALVAGRVEATVEPGAFLPASALKAIRRGLWQLVSERLPPGELAARHRARGLALLAAARPPAPAAEGPETVVLLARPGPSPIPGAVVAVPLDALSGSTPAEVALSDFCPEGELARLDARIGDLVALGVRRFRAAAIHDLELLRRHEGLTVTATHPIPACNALAVAELQDLGAARVTAWLELDAEAIGELAERCGGVVEVLTHGRPALLTTRLALPVEGEVRDDRGNRFRVARRGSLTLVYPDEALTVAAPDGLHRLVDLTEVALEEPRRSTLNAR